MTSRPATFAERAVEREPAPRASAVLAALFAPSVVTYEMREDGDATALLPEEAAASISFRPKRLAEFAAGRSCARRALDDLGYPAFALRQQSDRTPCWPAGVAGSITHTIGFCGVAADRLGNFASLGVDAEIVARVGRELWPHVLTPLEFESLAALDGLQSERFAALVFSAKEAFYKCQFALTRSWLDFTDVSVVIRPEGPHCGSFAVRAASVRASWLLRGLEPFGRYRYEGALVGAGLALDSGQVAQLAAPRPQGRG